MKVKLPSFQITKLLLNGSCPISSHYWEEAVSTEVVALVAGHPVLCPLLGDLRVGKHLGEELAAAAKNSEGRPWL